MATMTRTALIQLAATHTDPTPAATEMARQMASAESVQTATDSMSRQATSLEKRAGVLGCTGALSMMTAMLSGAISTLTVTPAQGAEPSPVAALFLAALLLFAGSMCLYFVAADKAEKLRKQLELLKPVVGARGCARALEYIDAGAPEVLAWHALAVAERGVLSEFDVAVLRDIHYAAKAARADEEARHKLYTQVHAKPGATHQ
jgi:hypothetical protein